MCVKDALDRATALDDSLLASPTKPPAKRSKSADVCFKIFVVVTFIFSFVTAVIGLIALIAIKRGLPADIVDKFSMIGEVNSALMVAGGFFLCALAVISGICHIKEEQRLFSPRVKKL